MNRIANFARRQFEEALVHYQTATDLRAKGKFQEAIQEFRHIIEKQPSFSPAYISLGNVLHSLDKNEEAIKYYRDALGLAPNSMEAITNLAIVLPKMGKINESIDFVKKTLNRSSPPPNFAAILCSTLGNSYKELGKIEKAVKWFRLAIGLQPDNSWQSSEGTSCPIASIHSNLLYTMTFGPYTDSEIYEDAAKWSAQHEYPLREKVYNHEFRSLSHDKIRVGYVSPDFYSHCQSFFTIPLLSNCDHTKFEIYCYSSVVRPDDVTQRIKNYTDVWRDVGQLSDEQLAQVIFDDEIDILVDLTMHMNRGRPLVFARKPAPIQVAWLAYPGTTGMNCIDYRFSDPYLEPSLGTETTIVLPFTFWCYDPLSEEVVNDLPAKTNGYITFGCLNNTCKLSDESLDLWSRVLKNVENSRMILLAPVDARKRILDRLKVDVRRIDFIERLPRHEYLKVYHRIDIGLDTLPYNGHTTTLDSLWMGVPVISLVGKTVVGRAGKSQLSNINQRWLLAEDEDEFVELAYNLSLTPYTLEVLRKMLRDLLDKSPIRDGKKFARSVENCYVKMKRK